MAQYLTVVYEIEDRGAFQGYCDNLFAAMNGQPVLLGATVTAIAIGDVVTEQDLDDPDFQELKLIHAR
jgi:hypothetical protein